MVTRDSLRHNFLRNIIIRLDFQILTDEEVNEILPKLKQLLKEKGFLRFNEGVSRNYNINVPQTVPADELTAKAISTKQYFSFINDTLGIKMDFSNSYFVITINSEKYIPFINYSSMFIDGLNVIKAGCNGILYKRLGIRKINTCLINDIAKINTYFSEKMFAFYETPENACSLSYNKKESFLLDNRFKMNLICSTQQGKANDDILHKVEVDIDIYSDNKEDIEKTILTQSEFSKLNDKIFDIYLNSLSREFVAKLMSETFDDSTVLGVNSNE